MYWITGILGAAFMVAPFLFGYSGNTTALWTSLLLGASVIVVSYLEGAAGDEGRWEYWVAIMAGLGAVTAPFILGFGSHTMAMWTSVIIGLMLAVVAGSKLYFDYPNYG